MSDFAAWKKAAIETMVSPPTVKTKLSALDAIDRLALNPSGWFPYPLLDKFDAARAAILTDRFNAAVVSLDDACNAMEEFIDVLKKGPEKHGDETREAALNRAKNELNQCAVVQAWAGMKIAKA